MLTALMILNFIDAETGKKATETFRFSIKEVLIIIPPIFVLMGMLDVWVPKEIMTKYMGEGSGLKGILLSIFIGSAAAGPLYGAFPVALIFMKKGVKFSNVIILMGAWSTTKIPMFLFEMGSLGKKFALIRLVLSITTIIVIAYTISSILSDKEKEEVYLKAEELS